MFAASSAHSSADGYFRAFDRNATFCTSPFIVVPKVRPKPPSALKKAGHHLLAIGAVGQRAQIVERRLIELDGLAVARA